MPYVASRRINFLGGQTVERGEVVPAALLKDLPGRGKRFRVSRRLVRYRRPRQGEPRDTWEVAGKFVARVDGKLGRVPVGTKLPDIEKTGSFNRLRRVGVIRLATDDKGPAVSLDAAKPKAPVVADDSAEASEAAEPVEASEAPKSEKKKAKKKKKS